MCKDMPSVAALMFTLSLGIKAGAILFMPAFLGVVMYRYGLFKLILCVVIIIGW